MQARRFTYRKKLEAVRKILAGRRSMSETARALKIQRYQLQAWVGQVCWDSPLTALEALRRRFEHVPDELEELTHGAGGDPYLSPPPPTPRARGKKSATR